MVEVELNYNPKKKENILNYLDGNNLLKKTDYKNGHKYESILNENETIWLDNSKEGILFFSQEFDEQKIFRGLENILNKKDLSKGESN